MMESILDCRWKTVGSRSIADTMGSA